MPKISVFAESLFPLKTHLCHSILNFNSASESQSQTNTHCVLRSVCAQRLSWKKSYFPTASNVPERKFCYKFQPDVLMQMIIKLLGQNLSFTNLIYHTKTPKSDKYSSWVVIPCKFATLTETLDASFMEKCLLSCAPTAPCRMNPRRNKPFYAIPSE